MHCCMPGVVAALALSHQLLIGHHIVRFVVAAAAAVVVVVVVVVVDDRSRAIVFLADLDPIAGG
jgi:hypothetical protein